MDGSDSINNNSSSSSDLDPVGGAASSAGGCYNTTTTTSTTSSSQQDGRSSSSSSQPVVLPTNRREISPTSLNDHAVQLLGLGRYDDAMQVWVEALQVISTFMNDYDEQHENVVCDVHEVDFREDEVGVVREEQQQQQQQQQEDDNVITTTTTTVSSSSSSSHNNNNNNNNDNDNVNEVQPEQPHMQSLYFGSTFTVLPYKMYRPEQQQQQQQQQQQNQHLVPNYDQLSSTSTSVASAAEAAAAAPSASASTTGMMEQDDDGCQRFFLTGPLKTTGNIQLEDEASCDLVSFMVMFNMGVCWHLKGLTTSTFGGGNDSTTTTTTYHHHDHDHDHNNDSSSSSGYCCCCPTCHHSCTACTITERTRNNVMFFSKAVELYNLAHSIVVRDGGSVDTMISSFHFMGLLSNMQHAYMMIGGSSSGPSCLQEAEECNDLLLKTLMYTIDQRSLRCGIVEDNDSYSGSGSSNDVADDSEVNSSTTNNNNSIASSAQGHYYQQQDIVEHVRRDVITDMDLMDNFVGNVLPRILDDISAPAA